MTFIRQIITKFRDGVFEIDILCRGEWKTAERAKFCREEEEESSESGPSAAFKYRQVCRRRRIRLCTERKHIPLRSFCNWRRPMPLGVALPPDSSRLQCKTTLSASRIYPALNYTDGRARVDEGSSVVGRFTGLLSSHPILITSNALYLCSRIVVAATTEIASRFDQRRHIYFGFRRSLPPLSLLLV